jgi:hypothetical protein
MFRRLFTSVLIGVLGTASLHAEPARFPLAPGSLHGPDIFMEAESTVAQAAQKAGLSFASDARPLPPQVILTLDTATGTVRKREGLLIWRGAMLPDQLAPEEVGTLIRKRLQTNGTWKITRTRKEFMRSSRTHLVPVARTTPQGVLPPMIIETAYHLGRAGDTEATLVLWRTLEEGTGPLAGFILLDPAATNLIEALASTLPPFEGQAGWTAEINALSP